MDINSKTISQTKTPNGNIINKKVYARFNSCPIFKNESSNNNAIKKIPRSLSDSSPFTRFQRRKHLVIIHVLPYDRAFDDVYENSETSFPKAGLDVRRKFNSLKRRVSGFFTSKTPSCYSLPTQPERHTYMVRCL